MEGWAEQRTHWFPGFMVYLRNKTSSHKPLAKLVFQSLVDKCLLGIVVQYQDILKAETM